MIDLTYEDVDTLIESLTKWEQDDMSGEIIGDLLGAMMSKDDPDVMNRIKEQKRKLKEEKAIRKRERERKSTILKAKLYEIQGELQRDSLGYKKP